MDAVAAPLPLPSIFSAAPWRRILMVPNALWLGRICDARTNGAPICTNKSNDARWRDSQGNRYSVVVWQGDSDADGDERCDVFRAIFGGARLTLVYNCASAPSIVTLAQLLLELYDVKLTGFRMLPITWWLGLNPSDTASITAMARVEYRIGDPRNELGISATLPARADHARVPAAFDPDTQMADADGQWAHFCDGYLCMLAATHYCPPCGQHLCVGCAERNHQEHADL